MPVHGHLLKGFRFVVIEDHGALVGTLKGLVASAVTCEAFDGARFDGHIVGVEEDEALGL